MCEPHGKKLDYFCLHHDQYYCRQCKIKNHEIHPCECLHVRDVYHRLQLDMEEHIHDLVNLRDRSNRIMDGSYQRNLLYRVNDEEIQLDRFYRAMKKKLKETKMQIKAFTSDELSAESRQQLQKFMSRSIPVKFKKNDTPRDMLCQLKLIKKEIHGATNLLYSLPNYIEVTVDQKFMKIMTYNDHPIAIKGRPKFMPQVSSDEEFNDETDFDDDLLFEKVDDADGLANRTVLNARVKRRLLPVENEASLTGVINWGNNMPSFNTSLSATQSTQISVKQHPRLPNKYANKIAEVKEKMTMPPISMTPEPIKNIRDKLPAKLSSKSMPDNVLFDKPVKKLFLRNKKNTKFSVRERFQLDGCEDAVVLAETIILSMGDSIQKRDRKTLKAIVEMKLARTANMCAINGFPTQIAVLQTHKCITVIETGTGLSVVYRIRVHQPYLDFSHVATTDTGPYHPSYVFAASYKGYPNLPANCLDVIQAKETRRPGRPPMFEVSAEEVNLLNQGYEAKAIGGIGGFSEGQIVLGTQDAIVCIGLNGKQIWKTAVPREVSGILCTKHYVYACVQDQKKILTFNKTGFITDDNVIPDLDVIPCKLSANWDMMLIKDFKTKAWVSIIFKHGLLIV